MLGAESHLGIGVVVEEGEVRPPAHPHGIAAVEHGSHNGLETLRPLLDGTHRGLRPVKGKCAFAHLAATGDEGKRVGLDSLLGRVAHVASHFSKKAGSGKSQLTATTGLLVTSP